jgi:hypothetical protein
VARTSTRCTHHSISSTGSTACVDSRQQAALQLQASLSVSCVALEVHEPWVPVADALQFRVCTAVGAAGHMHAGCGWCVYSHQQPWCCSDMLCCVVLCCAMQVNTKVDMRFELDKAGWIPDDVKEAIRRAVSVPCWTRGPAASTSLTPCTTPAADA